MKKLISMILALCLVMSFMVMPAAAAENNRPEGLDSATFNDAYDFVYGNGIYLAEEVEGDPNEYMKGIVTRGEYALYLARFDGADLSAYEGVVAFPDMEGYENAEIAAAVAWGVEASCISGYKDGTYKPDKDITREEICTLIARYFLEGPGKETDLPEVREAKQFADYEEYAGRKQEAYINYCYKHGLIDGYKDGTFGAGATGTQRAHMARILTNIATAMRDNTKFYLEVASGDGYVSARVNEDYAMVVTVADEAVDPSEITITAEMTNVASLGVSGTRTHSTTINTNIESDGSADLKVWLDNCFDFAGCAIDVKIGDKTCKYVVEPARISEETGDATILFIPENADETRAAWHELTSHISTESQEADDSYIIIANGSYLQLGEEVLAFESLESGDLKLDNFSSMDSMEEQIRSMVAVTTAEDEKVEAMVAAGTTLAVGSSVATLEDDCTITVDGVDASDMSGLLGDLRDADGTYAMAKALVATINGLVGTVEGETVNVEVTFG